ncbi:MAG: cupredoxin domain-containing protein [Candidatus Falkowbacteria bacterium]|nr:cupredoxin domain-containing protein [Candidatus Falkowbacteria bacterium]
MSSGSFMGGAMIMMVFALGTAPGLLSIGGLASSIGRSISKKFFKFAGLTLIFMALFNINNASTLLGFGFAPASNTNQKANTQNVNANDPNVQLVNNVQTVKMVESNRGYSPNSFTIKKGVPVRWVIDAQAPYSCASSIVIPKLNVSEQLKPGENVIEFTATEAGALRFSCSMGMYTGAFNVIN